MSPIWACIAIVLLMQTESATVYGTKVIESEATFRKDTTLYLVQHANGNIHCPRNSWYLGFVNKTCNGVNNGNDAKSSAGPVMWPPEKAPLFWKQWSFTTVDGGQNLVRIHTWYPSGGYGKPRCVDGELTPAIPVTCRGASASGVDIKHNKLQSSSVGVWKLVQVKNGVYNIIDNSRRRGCLRYLGVSKDCKSRGLQLYAIDDGTGDQQWRILPYSNPSIAPTPAPGPAPSPDVFLTPAANFSVSVTGYSVQTFGEQQQTAFCTSLVGSITYYPHNLLQCIVANISNTPFLLKDTMLRVYVRGYVAFLPSTESQSAYQAAGFAANQTVITLGSPQQTAQIFAQAFPNSTVTTQEASFGTVNTTQVPPPSPVEPPVEPPPVAVPSPSPSPIAPPPPTIQPSPSPVPIPAPLVPSGIITTPPVPESIPTPSGPPPAAPNAPTNVQTAATTSTSWTASWIDSSPAPFPVETYTVQCVSNGNPCTAAAQGNSATNIGRGVQTGQVTGLTLGTAYTCYVIVSNGIGGSVCSSGLTFTSRVWRSVSSSADGTKIVAVASNENIYLSTDSGSTFTAKDSVRNWIRVAMSSDGTKVLAGVLTGSLFLSTDGGNTYGATGPAGTSTLTSLSIAATGGSQMMVGFLSTQILLSVDTGANWNPVTVGIVNAHYISSSANGQYVFVAVQTNAIYYSTNYANSFTASASTALTWTSIASSSTGQNVVATVYNAGIYRSTDNGVTFSQLIGAPTGVNYHTIASSSNGQVLAASVNNGNIYVSNDAGTSWQARASVRVWQGITMSSDGQKIVSAVSNGQIWRSVDQGVTWNAIF